MSHFFGQGYMINNGGKTLQIENMSKALATLSSGELLGIKNLEIAQNISEIPLMFLRDELETISIYGGSFRKIPERVYELKKLKSLSITLSGLSGIDRIGELTSLTSLDVSSNYITNLPNNLVNLKKLSYLNIGHTNIAEFPTILTELKELKKLVLPAELRGKVPANICQEIKFSPAWYVWSNSKE